MWYGKDASAGAGLPDGGEEKKGAKNNEKEVSFRKVQHMAEYRFYAEDSVEGKAERHLAVRCLGVCDGGKVCDGDSFVSGDFG
ncbi:MAG: hypothetical protein ACLTGC_06325 [Eisenbergiella sp.]